MSGEVRRAAASRSALLATLALLAVLVVALGACGSDSNSSKSSSASTSPSGSSVAGTGKGIKIGFVALQNQPETQGVADGAKAAAAEFGASVSVVGPPSPNPTEQIAAFQNLAASGVKGLIVQAFPLEQWVAPIRRAIKQGIDVESELLPTDGSGTNYVVGPPDTGTAADTANYVASTLPADARGTVYAGICVPGLEQMLVAERAFSEAMTKARPGVTVKQVATAPDPTGNFAAWQRIVSQNPSALGFYGVCSQDLASLVKVKQQSSGAKWFSVTTGGESPLASAAILRGDLTAASSSRDFVAGYLAAYYMLDHLANGKPEPRGWINSGVDIMTKANAAEIARANASPEQARTYYAGLIKSLIANPAPIEPQQLTITKVISSPQPDGTPGK